MRTPRRDRFRRRAFSSPTQNKIVHASLRTSGRIRHRRREIVSIAPWNEVTKRVIICMSRAAMPRCNEELWCACDRWNFRAAGISDLCDRAIDSRERDASDRRHIRLSIYLSSTVQRHYLSFSSVLVRSDPLETRQSLIRSHNALCISLAALM